MIENAQPDTDSFFFVWKSSAIIVRIQLYCLSHWLDVSVLWLLRLVDRFDPQQHSASDSKPKCSSSTPTIFSTQTDTRCFGFIWGSHATNSLSNVACVSFSFHSKSAAVDFYHRRNSDI
jgi:hypothetical protein